MHKLAAVVLVALGCGGSAKPAPQSPPPPPQAEVSALVGTETKPPSEQVAIGDSSDPCEGGEATGTGMGGGGTGEATIGLGSVGTIGHGAGTGTGYGAGGGGGGRPSQQVPAVNTGTATVSGSLDKEIIRRIVKRHLNHIRYCYEKVLVKEPALAGKVTAKFTIDAKGAVSEATAGGLHPEVDGCVAAVIKRMEFPAPKGGGNVSVAYPFVFRPQ